MTLFSLAFIARKSQKEHKSQARQFFEKYFIILRTEKTNKHAILLLNVAFACRRVWGDEWLMAVGLFLLGSLAQPGKNPEPVAVKTKSTRPL